MNDTGKPNAQIYIGDLRPGTTEVDLEQPFRRFGTIRHVWVARNPAGFGFVDFEDYRDAEDAIHALDGTRINGATVKCEMSKGVTKRGGGDRRGGYEGRRDDRGGGGGGGGGERYVDRYPDRNAERDRYERRDDRRAPPDERFDRDRFAGGDRYDRGGARERLRSRSRSPNPAPRRRRSRTRSASPPPPY